MEEGKSALKRAIREIEILAESNECQMADGIFDEMARVIKALIATKIDVKLSREQSARYLGISVRQFARLVHDGKIAPGQNFGHKEKSWRVKDLEDYKKRQNVTKK